jgi:hypothetical protein
MILPTRRNSFFRNGSHDFYREVLTTALSNKSEISIAAKIAANRGNGTGQLRMLAASAMPRPAGKASSQASMA